MSFIKTPAMTGHPYAPGWFLVDDEDCTRVTREISATGITADADGGKHVPMGSFWPANDSSTVKGILYEDVDVTNGPMPGSVVTAGTVYLDRLPASPESGVQSALEGLGFKFITAAPDAKRPAFDVDALTALTVQSAAGTAAGDTKITVSGYTLRSGESYVYKVATGTAPSVAVGQVLTTGWTAWDGTSDITAATDKKITVAVVDATKAAIAAGSATVTAKS